MQLAKRAVRFDSAVRAVAFPPVSIENLGMGRLFETRTAVLFVYPVGTEQIVRAHHNGERRDRSESVRGRRAIGRDNCAVYGVVGGDKRTSAAPRAGVTRRVGLGEYVRSQEIASRIHVRRQFARAGGHHPQGGGVGEGEDEGVGVGDEAVLGAGGGAVRCVVDQRFGGCRFDGDHDGRFVKPAVGIDRRVGNEGVGLGVGGVRAVLVFEQVAGGIPVRIGRRVVGPGEIEFVQGFPPIGQSVAVHVGVHRAQAVEACGQAVGVDPGQRIGCGNEVRRQQRPLRRRQQDGRGHQGQCIGVAFGPFERYRDAVGFAGYGREAHRIAAPARTRHAHAALRCACFRCSVGRHCLGHCVSRESAPGEQSEDEHQARGTPNRFQPLPLGHGLRVNARVELGTLLAYEPREIEFPWQPHGPEQFSGFGGKKETLARFGIESYRELLEDERALSDGSSGALPGKPRQ